MGNGEIKKSGQIFELESKNFHVDSVGWERFANYQGVVYLENLKKDIWEYVGGVPNELIGQQLFSWSAGMRETKKVSKRMPTDEEWGILTANGKNLLNLKKVLSGCRGTGGVFYGLDADAHFWSSSVAGTGAWGRGLYSSLFTVGRSPSDQAYGFLVRCLKNR